MAFPTQIGSGSGGHEGYNPPFKVGSAWYAWAENDAAGVDGPEQQRSTDPTSSFTESDGTNAPDAGTINGLIVARLDGTTIHYAMQAVSIEDVYYSAFDTTGPSWVDLGTSDFEILALAQDGAANVVYQCDVAVRSDGDIIITGEGDNEANMGTEYQRGAYAVSTDGGSSFGTAAYYTDSGKSIETHLRSLRIVIGDSDVCHGIYTGNATDSQSLMSRALSSADSLQTIRDTTFDCLSGASNLLGNGVAFTRSAATRIRFIYRGAGPTGRCLRFDSGSDPSTFNSDQIDSNGIRQWNNSSEGTLAGGIAVDGSTVYAMYSRAGDADIYQSDDGGNDTWSTPTSIRVGTHDSVTPWVYDRSGKKLGYTFAQSGNAFFMNEEDISGGVTEGTGASSGAATVSGVGKARNEQDGSSSGSATSTAVGKSVNEQDGSSSGVATVDAEGNTVIEADGASSGVATANAEGVNVTSADGASSGVATTSAVGIELNDSIYPGDPATSSGMSASLSGMSDSKQGIISYWCKGDGAGVNQSLLYDSGDLGDNNIMFFDLNGEVFLDCFGNTTANRVLRLTSTSAVDLDDGQWHHVLMSWDVATGATHLYIDDVDRENGVDTVTLDEALDWTQTTTFLGRTNTNTQHWDDGCWMQIYINTDEYLDMDTTSNRRKFINADLTPVLDLGNLGQTPTGNQPAIYVTGPPDQWATNSGYAGHWTLSGTINHCALDGASSGVATVSGEGKSTVEATGSSSGISTADAEGQRIVEAVGASSGVATTSGEGKATNDQDGVSSGVATVFGEGEATNEQDGSSSGVATSDAEGITIREGIGASSGVATVSGVGETVGGIETGDGASSGTATVSGVGKSIFEGDGSSSGLATADAEGEGVSEAIGSSSGVATVDAQGVSGSFGAASGTSTVDAEGDTINTQSGSSSGVATVSGEGKSVNEQDGSSSGVAVVTATGVLLRVIQGGASGSATSSGEGKSVNEANGSSSGLATNDADGESTNEADGLSSGISSAVAIGSDASGGGPSGVGFNNRRRRGRM